MTVHFNLVSLGAFYYTGRPCDDDSYGTIVAIAANDQELKNFNILGEDLACYLRSQFPSIFYPCIDMGLKREHPTIWCTLGYVHENDFEIDSRLLLVLQLMSFKARITISQLEVRSYTNRSLEDSNLLDTIIL